MHPGPRTAKALWAVILGLSTFGCGGIDPLAEKERENVELRFENERRRESLIETQEDSLRLRQTAQDLIAEKTQLAAQVSELATRLKLTSDQLVQVTSNRDDARAKLTETQQLTERLRDSVDKVKEVASSSATELAELRLKRKELEEKTSTLSKNEAFLQEESAKLGKQVKELESQLAAARATPAPSPGDAQAQAYERELTGLRGENFALTKRLEALVASSGGSVDPDRSSSPPQAAASSGAPHSVYLEDPAGLFNELKGLLLLRYERARAGHIAWDSFDIGVVGAAGVIALFVLWELGRICFGRRKPRVRESVVEVEEAAGEAPVLESQDDVQLESVPLAVAEPAAKRRASVRRRSAFPAIISAKDLQARDEGSIAAQVSEQLDASFDAPELTVAATVEAARPASKAGSKTAKAVPVHAGGRETPAQEPRKIIGARSWEPEHGVDSQSDEDELASTQVIPTLSSSRGEDPVPVAVVPLKSQGSREKPAAKSPVSPAGSDKTDDRQLLAELKSVINRKFDELMK